MSLHCLVANDMSGAIYPWQHQDWDRLQRLRERLPHAILFHGAQGIGKVAFAEQFAQSVLCDKPVNGGFACGSCASCGWFVQYGHPDYRRVRPEILDTDNIEDDGEPEEGASKKSASGKAPSKEIRIEQVRSLAGFMNVSTHRSGLRVVLLYPAETLNSASANALLKTLEEPPPGTLFMLVSHRPDRLLPTILSRCRKFSLSLPRAEDALSWLNANDVSDARQWLALHGGAPLAAYSAAQDESASDRELLLGLLAKPDAIPVLSVAERLQKTPIPLLVAWQQRWLYDLFSLKLSGRIRYYPQQHARLQSVADRLSADRLQQALRDANNRRAIADHSLSPRLFIEDMLLAYVGLFD
jgi:DNA polymerase-3 subunit delta'